MSSNYCACCGEEISEGRQVCNTCEEGIYNHNLKTVHREKLIDRLKNAIRAFKGKPIAYVSIGIEVRRCDECPYKGDTINL